MRDVILVGQDPPRRKQRTRRTAARVLVRLSARVEPGGVTVSAEDQQGVRHWVSCDRPLPGGARCALPVDHLAPCARRARP
ncbi:hypothetical protein [Micromonospora arborensis]|uniref:hypothetical protein n=1 Tax=Micromonospora arborensis TaxID=2116518 RepID=UPI001FCA010E|nr:hypothetical protein [Micromonospora arborensis]